VDGIGVRALGRFDLVVDGRPATPSAPKPRQILALLSLRCTETVTVDVLVDELWGDHPPRGAVAALQTHVYELRKELHAVRARPFLLTRPNGYAVDLPPPQLDVTRFDDHLAAGGAALGRGDPAAARQHLVAALRMSTGRPLANVACGSVLANQVTRLQEARLRATELRVEADLLLGRDDEVIGELRVAVADHPYHEGFVLKLMTALRRRGRRAEALEAYRALRRRLVDELGVEPGGDLQQLHREVMRAGVAPADPPVAGKPNPAQANRPAQLPRAVTDFTGRDIPVRRATAHLLERSAEGVPPVVTITGMAGVGKSATAIHLAHAVRHHFPDGQLYLTRPDRTAPLSATGVAELLVRACGISDGGQDAASAFRTWCAGRRALVVLDDIAAPDHVQAVLPGTAGCAAIVTSRSTCDVPGACAMTLEPMDTDDGIAFLSRLLPDGRVDAEPVAAKGIVDAVGGLPLGLRHVATRLGAAPGGRLGAFLSTLTDALDHWPLSQVSAIGPGVHERLHSAYRELTGPDQHAFRLLSLLGRTEFTTDDAARAFLLAPVGAEMALLRLADAHMVRPLGDGRYSMPTLLRRLALECLTDLSTGSARA
jgi:DNA-binding SARP family transcriptional activator